MSTLNELLQTLTDLTAAESGQLATILARNLGVSLDEPKQIQPEKTVVEAPVVVQTEFEVVLKSFEAAKKINVIKEVRTITGLDLKSAKDLVEGAPKTLKAGLSSEDADKLVATIQAAGGVAEKN